MAIEIIKQPLIEEDMELGLGTVVQQRADATGKLKNFTYNKVNSDSIPHTATSTVKDEIDNRHTKSHVNGEFTKVNAHLSTHDTEIADRYTKSEIDAKHNISDGRLSTNEAAIADRYTKAVVDGKLGAKADKSNVLEKSGNTVYTPTNPYSPATMKYVLDTVVHVGAGDMAKAVYDKNDDGIVDNAQALEGHSSKDIFISRGHAPDPDKAIEPGLYTTGKGRSMSVRTSYYTNSNLYIRQEKFNNAGDMTFSRIGDKIGQAATVWTKWNLVNYYAYIPRVNGKPEYMTSVTNKLIVIKRIDRDTDQIPMPVFVQDSATKMWKGTMDLEFSKDLIPGIDLRVPYLYEDMSFASVVYGNCVVTHVKASPLLIHSIEVGITIKLGLLAYQKPLNVGGFVSKIELELK